MKGDQMSHSGIAYIERAPVQSTSSPVKHHVLQLKILQIATFLLHKTPAKKWHRIQDQQYLRNNFEINLTRNVLQVMSRFLDKHQTHRP